MTFPFKRLQQQREWHSLFGRITLFALVFAALTACGGGGGGGGNSSTAPSTSVSGIQLAANYEAKCISPRIGINPTTGKPYADVQGLVEDEKSWVRAWINEFYLWYREVPDLNQDNYATAVDYFNVLKTSAVTALGKPKDRFHFVSPTSQFVAEAQSGIVVGYGIEWNAVSATPPRDYAVGYVEPGSPAALANIGRGAHLFAVDNVPFLNGDAATLNAGLFPTDSGQSHLFSIVDAGSVTPRTLTLISGKVQTMPVPAVKVIATATGNVGYILFNDHMATAETALMSAIGQLKGQGISDLVLDIRYNGGGYLAIASELAYMIAGPAAATGKAFQKLVFNDKYPAINPFTGGALTATPFYSISLGFSAQAGQLLPYLGLNRVFVLTGAGTCSASEAIINSLRGINVEVVQIGSTTCGKPYGFYQTDNCGTTYFAINFQGTNDQGFGSYDDGFTPAGTGPVNLPGCKVADDFSHALGDADEGRLASALRYRTDGTCPPATLDIYPLANARTGRATSTGELQPHKSPFRENQILEK